MANDGRRSAAEHPIDAAAALRFATSMLTQAGSDTPRLDAEVLLRHATGTDRAALFSRLRERLAADEAATFMTLLGRRVAGEPIAYLTGTKEFMGIPLAVGPGALIPRPETEILVEWALRWLADRPRATVVDIGTGSGAIALALAAHRPPGVMGRIVALDRSPAALAWAERNRRSLAGDVPIDLAEGDLTVGLAAAEADLILANLPYLTPVQIAANPLLAAEPEAALLGGEDGLDLVRRLVADLPRVLAADGAVGLELDPSQTDAVAAMLAKGLRGARVRTLPDLAGLPRHVVATRGNLLAAVE